MSLDGRRGQSSCNVFLVPEAGFYMPPFSNDSMLLEFSRNA